MNYLLQQGCRTTRSCINGPYHQGCGPDSIEKDSWLARRADRSRQRQARLHTVRFGLAEGRRPDGEPTTTTTIRLLSGDEADTWSTRHCYNLPPQILESMRLLSICDVLCSTDQSCMVLVTFSFFLYLSGVLCTSPFFLSVIFLRGHSREIYCQTCYSLCNL